MSKETINVVAILSHIAEALKTLSEEEIKRLSDPQYVLELKVIRRKAREAPALLPADMDIGDVVTEITALPTRQDAQSLLAERYPSKKALEIIARKLDIPIIKQDKIEDLREKIVEATVGAKIRSQTIQGTG